MTVIVKFENVKFHKVVNIPEKTNCVRCDFKTYGHCALFTELTRNRCDDGKSGYWTYKDFPIGEVISE
jgi:hypothetical protein